MTTIIDAQTVTVETSPTFTVADFAADSRLVPTRANTGAGQHLGTASFRVLVGDGRLLSTDAQAIMPFIDYASTLVGKLVRILVDGTPYWLGIITGTFVQSDGGEDYGSQVVEAEEIQTVFRRSFCRKGIEQSIATGVVETLSLPPFNQLPNGDRFNDPTTFYHDRTGAGVKWTAFQALDYLILYNFLPFTVTVNAVDNCLNYILPTTDFTGMTVWDAINALANQRRSLIWTLEPSYSGTEIAFTLTVRSTSPVAVASGSGYTLPASPSPFSFDATNEVFVDLALSFSDSATYDRIRVIGDRPIVALTIEYADLAPLWTTAQQTAYGVSEEDPETEGVYRTFTIDDNWNWSNYNETAIGIANELATTTVGIGSVKIYTGARSYNNAGSLFPASSLEISGILPPSIGWGSDPNGERQRSVMLWQDGSTWRELSGSQGEGELSLTINNGADGKPSISIGSAKDRETLKIRHVDDGDNLLLTVAFREPYPLMIEQARETMPVVERVLEVSIPARYSYVLQGTVKGANPGGSTLDTYASTTVIDNDLDTMRDVLALLWAFYSEPSVQVSFNVQGQITKELTLLGGSVGDLIKDITTSYGVVTCNNVITSISWAFTESGLGTSFQTSRFVPDLEVVL